MWIEKDQLHKVAILLKLFSGVKKERKNEISFPKHVPLNEWQKIL